MAGRAIWNLFGELGQSPATPPCAGAPGQLRALPAQLQPERGRSVGESRQAAARGQGVLCARGLLSFSCGHPGWLPSDRLGGWLYCPTAWRYARFTEVGAVFQVSSRQLLGSFVNTTPAQSCCFLGLVPGGNGNTISSSLWLPCLHTQPVLSVCLPVTNVVPQPDVRLTQCQVVGLTFNPSD